MSKLLINEPYIPVSVALMLKIKPSRAIVLQKLYSLTIIKNNYLADFQDWNGLIPYLSDDQLKNILIWLEGNNLIISKSEKGKRGKWYSINLKGITEFGLEVIEDYIFPMSRKNKKKSFILPSLVKLVGIPSAIIIQDFYFNNGIAFYQMKHKKIINEFIYFKSRRQIEIIFQDLQNRDIFKSELRDDSNKNEGKFYAVNKRNIYALLGVCFTEYVENEQNEARSEPVDKSLIVDNFNNQNRISAGLKPNFSGTTL